MAGRKALFATLLSLMAFFRAHADTINTIQINGVRRVYMLHVPANAGVEKMPLVFGFHGSGGVAARFSKMTNLNTLSDQRGFIAVYPQGLGRRWNLQGGQPDDMAFVTGMITQISATYKVDPTRIYAMGMSNGAIFSELLACNMPGRFAAIAAVAGTLPADISTRCPNVAPVSVLLVNGTADPLIPYQGGPVRAPGFRGLTVLSVDQVADFWAGVNKCAGMTQSQALPLLHPGMPTSITRRQSTTCPGDTSVVAYTVVGGGHAWPGGANAKGSRQMNATAAIVDFFLAHQLAH